MTFNIYISKNSNFIAINQYIIHIFSYLNIPIKFIDNYTNQKIDLIIKAKYDMKLEDEDNYKKNITIINCLKKNYELMNKDLLKDYENTPYFFTIFFDNKKYNKEQIRFNLNKYIYKENFGKDYWILKNTKSGRGIGTFLVKTEDLYNLENNEEFKKQIIKFPSKTTYVVQKYLEKPILYNDKKYDIRAHILLITKYIDNKIIYKFYLYKDFEARITTIDNNLNNLNLDTDKEKNLLFIKNIIFEIKNKILEIKKNNSSKLDLKNILNNTNDIQDKYCKLLNNGEIKLNDIISGLFVLINNKEECDEILKEFDINDIIDSDNILDELTNMLPLEYRSIITLLKSNDSSNENFNPMDLLSSFLGNNDNKNMELTKEQLDELEEFYSKLKIE